MAEGRSLRRIGDPVVAAAPAGVRLRTRIRPTAEEAEALTAMGELLGSVYRGELVGRIRLGRLDRTTHARWRAERKQAVTAVSSSRWAGAITRAVEDQYQLGMRGVAAQVADLRAAVEVLAQRCVLRPGQLAPVEGTETHGRSRRRRGGYRSAAERFAKTRRLAVLRDRLGAAEDALTAGRPSITVGGKRLWRNRNHLDATDMDEQQWRDRWDAARMFLTADGESGKPGGNETIRVDEHGQLRVKVPSALVEELGTHLQIAAPVRFTHRGGEWLARVAARRAVRYDISYDPERGRWYLDASWKTSPEPVPSLDELRTGRVLGVDLNDGHLAAWVLDVSGNPIGEPVSIEVDTAGLPASRRDGRVRAAITDLLDHAQQHNCSAVVVENLNFADARATGRETLGRGQRGKRLRRTVAGIPTARFRTRLTGMASPPRDRRDRGGPGLHQPLGCSPLARTPATADFRTGHRAPCRGGRDRQTWPRTGDQAAAGRTPQRTADRCGQATGQARTSAEHHTTTARQFRPTDTPTTRHAGPPENTHRQRPTPFGPHRTHSCSLTRNG